MCRDKPALPPFDSQLNAGSFWLLGAPVSNGSERETSIKRLQKSMRVSSVRLLKSGPLALLMHRSASVLLLSGSTKCAIRRRSTHMLAKWWRWSAVPKFFGFIAT